jgi:hypothetical protein
MQFEKYVCDLGKKVKYLQKTPDLGVAETIGNDARVIWQAINRRASADCDGYHTSIIQYRDHLNDAKNALDGMKVTGNNEDDIAVNERTRKRLSRSFRTHAVFANSLRRGGLKLLDRAHEAHVRGIL